MKTFDWDREFERARDRAFQAVAPAPVPRRRLDALKRWVRRRLLLPLLTWTTPSQPGRAYDPLERFTPEALARPDFDPCDSRNMLPPLSQPDVQPGGQPSVMTDVMTVPGLYRVPPGWECRTGGVSGRSPAGSAP